MEFFSVAQVSKDEAWIQQYITIGAMPDICPSIAVNSQSGSRGLIDTVWGEFEVQHQKTRGGVRFTLTTCPNALAWTITTGYPPAPKHLVIHCTINRTKQSDEFVQSIEEFAEEWRQGLEQFSLPLHS